MNRKRRGFTSRPGTPSRSRLNTDDWYNLLFQQNNQQSQDEITNAVNDRTKQYNKDTNFSRFMDATTVADDEFATVKAFQDKPKNELSEIIVTPGGATTDDEIKKQREASREMLKTKRWLSGLSGDKSFSNKDNDELKQLDTWHDIIYRDNQYANQFKKYMWTPNTIQERAEQQAKDRIKSIVSGGAPEGYWLRTAKQIGTTILEGQMPWGIPNEYDPFYYLKYPVARLYDWAVYDEGEKKKSNLIDDISTTFQKRINETQIDNSKGKIQRTQEMQLLGSLGMDQLKEAMDNTDRLRKLKNDLLIKQDRGLLTVEDVARLRNIDNEISNSILNEGVATKKLDTLSTYEAENPITQAWSKLNYVLDKIDFAYDLGIRDDLRGLKDALRSLYHYRAAGDRIKSEEYFNKVNDILEKFNTSAEKVKEGWNRDIQKDEGQLKDITDRYSVSPYFEAQDQLSQELGIFSPKKALFSSAGLLGASMSSTPKSLLKLGSIVLGLMSGAGEVNYGMLGAAGLINLISGGAQATDENNAEVGGTYSVGDFVQQLINHNVDKSVLKEGRKLLHNEDANLEDVINAFTRGEIMFNDKNNRNAMLNIIAGANQQWAYDMNATAPGVWVDAAITVIPDAAYARAIKFGKQLTPKALRQAVKGKLSIFDDLAIESNIGVNNIPLEELVQVQNAVAAKGIKSAMYVPYTLDMEVGSEAAKRAGIEAIDALRTKFTTLSKMSKYMPNKWLGIHGPNVMRSAKKLAARSITGMGSEFWEEDVQSIRQHQRQNGEYGSEYISGAYNPKIILDNIFRGVRSSWDFVFKDPLHATQEEKEIWKEAKLGALGWLAQGGIPVIAQTANGSWQQYTATEAAATNIRATKAEDDALIQKGIVYAQKSKTVEDYDRMMQAFDDIERTNKEKNKKADENGEQAAFPQNYIEENRKLYQTIFNLAHNPDIINAAQKAGIDTKSEDFDEFVSIMARQKDIFMDSVDKYDDTESSIENSKIASKSEVAFTKWLEDNGLLFIQDKKQKKSGHRGHPISEQKREELRKKFEEEVDQKYQLAELGALIQLVETYSAIQNQTQRQSRMLKTLQGYLDDLNKRREADGFAPIKTTADVDALVKDKIFHDSYKPEYSALYGLTIDVNMAEDIWLNALVGKEVVENGKKKRMYTGKSLVDRYKKTSRSDRDLQETLENDFFETLRRDDEIKKWISEYDFRRDNSFYQGFDGKWYYAKKVKSQDGSERVVKYEIKNGRPAGNPIFFDDEEFYTYHEMVKRDVDIELGEDSTEEERREAGERRLGRERAYFDFRTETLDEFHQNRAREIAELELQGQEPAPEQPTLPTESIPTERQPEPEVEEPFNLSLEQLEQESQEVESANRVERMFAEGWIFYNRPTKKGKPRYMAKLGNKKVSLSQEEGEEAMALQNALPPSQSPTYRPFLSGKIEDYEYDPASYKGIPGSHNAIEEAVIGIMNAAYAGNEARFNELLTWARNSLTNDQIDELKLLFAEVNGYFARDVKWVEDVYNERIAKADKQLIGNEIYKKVSDFITKYSIALFKFGRLIANMPAETVETWVDDFSANTNKQYRSILLGEGKKGLTPQGINKALQTIALVRAKFRFIDEGNGKYSAQAETGERYNISKAQYEFAEYVKDKFQPKQLELSFDEEPAPQDNPQPAEPSPEPEVQPEVVKETQTEEIPVEVDLGEQLLQQGVGFTGSFLQNFKESTSTRPSKTTDQDRIINLLSAYDKELNPDILHQYTTASHYFIRQGGKVVLYKRVHEYLKEPEQDVLNDVTSKRYRSASYIYNRLVGTESYEDYTAIIDEVEKNWNDVLAEKYGISSYTYNKRAISLAGYKLEDVYNDSKEEVARAIANIASINEITNPQTGEIVSRSVDIVKRYVDAGNIVDEIIRDIFSGKTVTYNEAVHKMSRETFDAFVEDIKDRKAQLDRIGIRVLTDEIITFAEINGIKVAGVMDMVAVDPFGNTYIIDFKTTYQYGKYNKKSTTGTPIKGVQLHELDTELKNLGEDETIEFNRQSLEGYRKQLSVYRHLLKLQHGINVKHMFIAPILVSHKQGKNEVTGFVDSSNYVFGGFNEGGIRPYKVFRIEPDNSIFEQHEPEPDPINYDEIDALLNSVSDNFEKTSKALFNKKDQFPSGELLNEFAIIKEAVDKAISAVDALKDGRAIEEQSVRDYIQAAQLVIDNFNNIAREFFTKKQSESQQPIQPVQNGGIPNTPQGHQLNPEKRDAYGEYRKYNNLEIRKVPTGWSQQKWRDFKRVSTLPDFLEKSRWELNTKSYIRLMGTILNGQLVAEKPSINVTIYYTEHKSDGSIVEHQFGGILMHIADENNGVKMQNKRLESPLIQKIDSILFDKKADGSLIKKPGAENKRIILTNKSRTNGIIQYDNNNMHNVQIAIGINDAEIEGLQDGNSIGQLGLMSHGNIRPITKSRNDDIIPIYTFGDGREMTDGMVGLKRNLPYTEDKDAPTHTPIIPLTPKQLHESDIDLILDILKNYGKYVNQSYKITIDGKEYESPVRANAILNNLIRFGDSARKTQSRFVFDFIEENGKTNFSKVQITNWGTDQYSVYDLTTAGPMGIDGLREHLKSGGYVYYNNENLMRHGTSRGLDTTPGNLFENLEQFFKDHPEINQIKYSDSMIFDRRDVDPDENGSYNGIRGYHWMMRHGWMLSAYQSIELPVMAATDAEEGTPYDVTTTAEGKKQDSVLPEQPKPQQTSVLPTIEEVTKIIRDGDSNKPSEVDDPTVGPINLWQEPGLGNLYDEGPVLPKTVEKRAETSLNEEQAKRRISHILGKDFPVRFIPDVIKTLKNGHVVVGQLNRAGITLASAAENGVEFHEAFHAIVEILLPETIRKRLYEHYRQKYADGRKLNDRAVAEGLADLYYEFKIGSPEVRLTWNIAKIFKNVWQYAKALWSINDVKMAALFWASDLGLMRLFKADSAKFEALTRRFGEGLNYELVLRDGRKSTLKNFNNHKEVDDLVEVLLYKMVHDYGVEVLGSNLDRLDTRYSAIATLMMATKDEKKSMTEAINSLKSKYGDNAIDHIPHSKAFKQLVGEGFTDKQLLKALHDGKISPLAYRNAMMFREAFDKWDVFRTLVEEKLKQKGVDKKRIREEQAREDRDGGEGYKQEEFGHFDQPFYEHSMRDDVPTRIKFFLSTRPNRRWATPEDVKAGFAASTHMDIVDEDGKKKRVRIPVDVRNNSMGYSTYASYQLVYNTLLRTAHHAKSIKEFDDILHKLGENDFLLYNIAKSYHNFRRKMYVRYQSENDGKYRNIPKVIVKGKLLNPSEYISDTKHLTEDEEFPTVVRYTHDVYDEKTSKLLHRQGDIIQEAIIQTDADYEQLVVQLFQAVHAQKLDYQFMFASGVLQADGKPTGKYSYKTDSTNVDQSMQSYPHLWFDSIRSAWGGILTVDKDSNVIPVVYDDGRPSRVFTLAAMFFRDLRSHTASQGRLNRHNVVIDGEIYDMSDPEGFDIITSKIVQVLNSIGVDITKQAFNYMLLSKYPHMQKIEDALVQMLNSSGTDSINPLIDSSTGVLETLQTALDKGNFGMFTSDTDTTGSTLYAKNGFLMDLAKWVGKYRLAAQESMTLGPENTKMYTYAQHHSASDTTDSLNDVFDNDGNMKTEGVAQDLRKSPYVLSEDGREGSIIIRNVLDKNFNPRHNRLVLSTSSGVKLNIAGNGGTKYSEITVVEDWLSKAAILQDGHIIFPTLSDKATWFFLRGIRLPGFNYDDFDERMLPIFTHTGVSSRMLFDRSDYQNGAKQQKFYKENRVLDQLIEYAYRELDFVNQTINQLGIQDVNLTNEKHLNENDKIKNFHTGEMHGARFAFLTGVYGAYDENDEFDETKDVFYDFNIYDPANPEQSVLQSSRERAMRTFFDKREGETDQDLKARQRSMIANILQHRMMDQLNDLVDKGIIERLDVNQAKFRSGKIDMRVSPFLGFKNNLLDDKKIQQLKEYYKKQPLGNGTYGNVFTEAQLESAAIAAYVYDITAKSIMSKEETQRVYTGFPHFFKWKFDEEGHLIDIMEDESKRLGGEGSTGTSNVLDLPNLPKTYRVAEIKDWEITSPFAKALAKAFKDNEYRDALINKRLDKWHDDHLGKTLDDKEADAMYDEVYSMPLDKVAEELGDDTIYLDEKIKAESESYVKDSSKNLDGINVADGTAFITDKMAENLLRMRGAWNNDVRHAFEHLRGNKRAPLNSAKAYRIIYDALIGTQKYSAFGYRMQNGVPVHYYNKYALFPIFKDIAYGFTSELYKKMNDPKTGVDMVMMTSAVKSGSQAAQKFNPEMTAEDLAKFSFKDNTYVQQFSQIRRQLNTDPHEKESQPMGTQAVKVALSTIRDNQLYTRADGSQIRGRDLKNSIMDNIKKLSEIGKKRLTDRFFKDDKLDITEFARFAEEELGDRGADKNLLDAIRSLYQNPSTILNSVSNMAWIESVMVSIINKNIIDVNLPGNAFYQRSVFGMEGIMSDSQFPTLNGGRPLQMINEEGSMDAVISIDYFYNIIPRQYRYNFDKAKQWLIDNGIISGVKSWSNEWSDAKANTISYRIPTQGISSVHALRFVDVVPIIRDTIILPKEFTKITGSDFDIDKLYLSSINYKMIKSKDDYLPVQRDIFDATDKFDKETEADMYYQNELVNDYLTLLKDAGKVVKNENPDADNELLLGRYVHYLHRSIDNDTSLVKGVLKEVEKNRQRKPVEPFVVGSLYTQSNLKDSFITGKFLIAPFALNLNSHIMTQLYNVGFKSAPHGIMTALGAESLARRNDRDGNSILSWLSAFINACVDVAKDPYILRLNVNKYTVNNTILLIRTGFGKDALYFTRQPIMKDLATKVLNESGDVVADPSLSPYQRQIQTEKQYALAINYGNDRVNQKIKRLYGWGNNKYNDLDFQEDEAVFKALFGILPDEEGYDTYVKKSKTILQDLITNRDVLIDKDGDFTVENMREDGYYEINGTKYSPRALQGYVFIAKKLFDDYSEALNNLVQTTKIDTKKHGINFLEQQDYLSRYNDLKNYETNMFDENLISRDKKSGMLVESFIDQKTNDAIDMLPRILKSQMIHMTDGFRDMVNKVSQTVNNNSKDTRAEIQKQLLTYTKQKVMNRIMEERGIDWNNIIHGPNNLATRIVALKHKIQSDTTGKYSYFASYGIITNQFLENLYPVPYQPTYGQDRYSLIQLDNSLDDDPDIENAYIDGWQQMWESDDEEIKNVALDLAIYAFMTSGDNRGFTKFFKYVPLKLREDIGYVSYMNTMYDLFNLRQMQFTDYGHDFSQININEFLRNNWRNNKIIPVFNPWRNGKYTIYGNKTIYRDINKANGMEIYRNTWEIFAPTRRRDGSPTIGTNPVTGLYPPFIKMRRPYASSKDADPYLLYRLVSIGIDKEGHEKPIYALANQKGISVRAGSQLFEIFEYDRNDQNSHVMTGHYLDDINWEEVAQKIANSFVEKYKADPTFRVNDNTFLDKNSLPEGTPWTYNYKVGIDQTTGNETVSTEASAMYGTLLMEMWRAERNARRVEKEAVEQNRPITENLRWSDKFKKFCKGK